MNTWLSFRSAQPSKVAQFSVGGNTRSIGCLQLKSARANCHRVFQQNRPTASVRGLRWQLTFANRARASKVSFLARPPTHADGPGKFNHADGRALNARVRFLSVCLVPLKQLWKLRCENQYCWYCSPVCSSLALPRGNDCSRTRGTGTNPRASNDARWRPAVPGREPACPGGSLG